MPHVRIGKLLFVCFLTALLASPPVHRPGRAERSQAPAGFAARLSAGGAHSLGVRPDGSVWAWGDNHVGQLGRGGTTAQSAPLQVSALTGSYEDVSAGLAHSLALRSDGVVYAWGANGEGQLGDGTTTSRLTPVQVANLTNVTAIAAGGAHSLALKADGGVWAWGRNAEGQLGDGTLTRRVRPVRVGTLTGYASVAAGGFHSLALHADGRVRGWGANQYGQLGDGTLTGRRQPTLVPTLAGINSVAAGGGHSLAVGDDGRAYGWGWNQTGQVGDGTTTNRKTPVIVGGVAATLVSAGGFHSVASTPAGAVIAWGANDVGQLGDGTTTRRLRPVTVLQPPALTTWISAGGAHTVSLEPDLSAWSWGNNFFGQLGDGSTKQSLRPIPIGGPNLTFGAVAPTLSPEPGVYGAPLAVTVGSETPGATIRYTTTGADPSGTDPSLPAGGSIPVDRSTTIKARAFKSGVAPSPVVTGVYTLQVAEPIFTPPGGTFSTSQSVTVATATADATIRFTTDGSEPVEQSPELTQPLAVAASSTVNARAFRAGWESSAVRTEVYVINAGSNLPPDPATVAPSIDPTVATNFADSTAFLFSGSSPIQRGVDAAVIERHRVSVLKGVVRTRDGGPLAGVRVSVPAVVGFGHTLTRTDGAFDLAVNGGGPVTIEYARTGYLPSQRTVDVPWNDYVVAPDVRLVQLDSRVTTLDFAANGAGRVARGNPVTDAAGTRQATLIVPDGGVFANLHLPDGTVLPAQSHLAIRATVYTVGPGGLEAMPATLPPTSGYTYAVELTADETLQSGAKVTFEPALAFYVENFLEFSVGSIVPTGYYDRDLAAWIPSNNGLVVRMLSVDANGLAELDANGDGAADTAEVLGTLGVTAGERPQLAGLYQPGQTLWRVPISHFTPWTAIGPQGLQTGPRSHKGRRRSTATAPSRIPVRRMDPLSSARTRRSVSAWRSPGRRSR